MTEKTTFYDANTLEELGKDDLEARFNSYIDSFHPEVLILQYSFSSSEVLKNAPNDLYEVALSDHIDQMIDNGEIMTEYDYNVHVLEVLESFTEDLLGEVMAHTTPGQDIAIKEAMQRLLRTDKLVYERSTGGRYTLETIELGDDTSIVDVLDAVVTALKNVKE